MNWRRSTLPAILVATAFSGAPPASQPTVGKCQPGKHGVGFLVFKWSCPAADGSRKPLATAVWYPVSAHKAGKHEYMPGLVALSRTVVGWCHGLTRWGLSRQAVAPNAANDFGGWVVARCLNSTSYLA